MKKHINYFSLVNEFVVARFVFEETPEGGAHDSYARQIEEIEKRLDENPDQAAEYALKKAKGDLLMHNDDLDKMQKIWQTTVKDLAKRNVDLTGIEEAELQKAEKEIQKRDTERDAQTNEELGRAVEARLNAKETKAAAEAQAHETVQKGLEEAKKIIGDLIKQGRFYDMNEEKVGKMTNAWTAWAKDSPLFKGDEYKELRGKLQKYLGAEHADLRKLWRGEMVQFMLDDISKETEKLDKIDRTDDEWLNDSANAKSYLSNKFVKILEAQKVPKKQQDAKTNIDSGMGLDRYLKKEKNRTELAEKMKNSKGFLSGLNNESVVDLFPAARSVEQVSILIGDRMMDISPSGLWTTLSVDHLVFVPSEAKIYGQMKNGCEGNLVIIRTGFNKQTYTPPV